MGTMRQRIQSTTGFTVVELLVVIVVLGIVTTVAVFGYGNWRGTTNDAKRRSDVQQVANSLSAYAIKANNYVEATSGCGRDGEGNGWLGAGPAHTGAGTYPRSIVECLQDANVLSVDSYVDPSKCIWNSSATCGVSGGTPTKAYMKATCMKSGRKVTYVMAYLETKPQIKTTVDALCDVGTVDGFDSTTQKWGTNFSMNYYVTVK
jgi:prepilin-type N-terminal cleavage/methylation domain-containing protein